jgi:hypothetical protein
LIVLITAYARANFAEIDGSDTMAVDSDVGYSFRKTFFVKGRICQ